MISFKNGYFHLSTDNTSYIFYILPSGHLTQLHYGQKLRERDEYPHLYQKKSFYDGGNTMYSKEFDDLFLNHTLLELPGYGKGDHRLPAIHLQHPDGTRVTDPLYISHTIIEGSKQLKGLPYGRETEGAQTLEILLKEAATDVEFHLLYTVFPVSNTITRSLKIINNGENSINIDRICSTNLDLPTSDYEFLSLEGKWIREKHVQKGSIPKGITRIGSTKLVSSADHSPFLALSHKDANENHGVTYGFLLLYSGDHMVTMERSPEDNLRIQLGISDFDFSWKLDRGESFQTPVAVMTMSPEGLNGMSQNFHNFFLQSIINPRWSGVDRPLLFNSWEAMYFDFNEHKLMKLAKAGKELGMELFVMDDGWFKGRNDETSSLGDWVCDTKKLPGGLEKISKKIKNLGLQFGIWVEPEMVSPDSDLYRSHPEWAVEIPGRPSSTGRNQLILDLTNPAVIDYLEVSLKDVFDRCRPDYVKWDMNRCGSDLYSSTLPPDRQKEFSHRYVLGLYDLLERITSAYPDTLFESCASGGNRYDGGMLYYMPQTWASDNTDPGSRMLIQHGNSYIFPLSTMGAHVGSNPNHQILRNNSIEDRFNCAAFGCLGYELDMTALSTFEKKVMKKQVEWYKEWRSIFHNGIFYRLESPFESNYASWLVWDKEDKRGIIGHFQQLQHSNPNLERIYLKGLNPEKDYEIETVPHYINIEKFGDLINHVLPFKMKTSGIPGLAHKVISENYLYEGEKQKVIAGGDELMYSGFKLLSQFNGLGTNEFTRIMGDISSRLYMIKEG